MTATAQGRPNLTGIHHISITATDLDASVVELWCVSTPRNYADAITPAALPTWLP